MTVAIVGLGLHRFGRSEGVSGLDQGAHALQNALCDAGLAWRDLNFVIGGSRDGGRLDGLTRHFGLSGAPITNVFNGCATGASALSLAAGMINSGQHEIGAVLGFDKHERGAFSFDPSQYGLPDWFGKLGFGVTAQFFGLRAQRYMAEHGISPQALARVASKASTFAVDNPMAWRRKALSVDEVLASPMVCDPLRKLMFCSPSEGGAAVILCSERLAKRLDVPSVKLAAVGFSGKKYGSFEIFQTSLPQGLDASATTRAAELAFQQAGIEPKDVDVAQIQDTDSAAELIHMGELGLCEHGEQEYLMAQGETGLAGRLPINTDGGCLANGEPIGASALRQVCEVAMQLRGQAGARQVPGQPKVGLTHVYGAPGISVVSLLQV